MIAFKCKMCGAPLEFEEGATVGVCSYCGTMQTLPRLDDERRVNLYDRANDSLRNSEFDKAAAIYEQILADDDTDAEAYWQLVLCRYGIEYGEDPQTHRRVPTVNRKQFTSVLDDNNYKAALEYGDESQRSVFEEEAGKINEIQREILEISQNEEPFDVFICYRETEEDGSRTQDSVLATDLYYLLTQEGFKVFFSRITLEDKLGTEYEPYIFSALNSAKVMVVLGTKPEHFNSVWVRNEWSRFLSLVKESKGKKALVPAYRDMDPYDLPEEFSHLQAQDMSKLGFMQDIIRGIRKLVNQDKPEPVVRENLVINSGSVDPSALLRRAFLCLEDGEWETADGFCEQVLNQEPENAEAYLAKLMAELHVHCQDELAQCREPFDKNKNYKKVIRFGDEKLVSSMKKYIISIHERNERLRKKDIYKNAAGILNTAHNRDRYLKALKLFKEIPGFRDADTLAEVCYERAEECRKDAVYSYAGTMMNGEAAASYEEAISALQSIPGWRDSDSLIITCRKKIEEIRDKEEAERLEKEQREEAERLEALKRKKKQELVAKIKKCTNITLLICVVFFVLLFSYIIPFKNYRSALQLYNEGKYEEAYDIFNKCDYGDSSDKAMECRYNLALEAFLAEDYESAYLIFNDLSYMDSREKAAECKYLAAMRLFDSRDYERAYDEFRKTDYEDSSEKAMESMFLSQKNNMTDVAVGATLKFGLYEQDGVDFDGKEEIEWTVLAKDGSRALLITEYALDKRPFNSTDEKTSWEKCTLRSWLNETFYDSAFSDLHKEMIAETTVVPDINPWHGTAAGGKTRDKLFVLSLSEAGQYFASDASKKCHMTRYCQGKYHKDECRWWLRTPGIKTDHELTVGFNGGSDYCGHEVDYDDVCIRPAMWIDLGKTNS